MKLDNSNTVVEPITAAAAAAAAVTAEPVVPVQPATSVGDLRPEVLQFALVMETELRAEGFRGYLTVHLQERLQEEVRELEIAVFNATRPVDDNDPYPVVNQPPGLKSIKREAADVANFAMMLAVNEGGLLDGK